MLVPELAMDEPGGISYHPQSQYLYIADTNKHCIRRTKLPHEISETMMLSLPELVRIFSATSQAHSVRTVHVPQPAGRGLCTAQQYMTATEHKIKINIVYQCGMAVLTSPLLIAYYLI